MQADKRSGPEIGGKKLLTWARGCNFHNKMNTSVRKKINVVIQIHNLHIKTHSKKIKENTQHVKELCWQNQQWEADHNPKVKLHVYKPSTSSRKQETQNSNAP